MSAPSVCLVVVNVCAINFIKFYIEFYVFLLVHEVRGAEKILCAIKKIDCAREMVLYLLHAYAAELLGIEIEMKEEKFNLRSGKLSF